VATQLAAAAFAQQIASPSGIDDLGGPEGGAIVLTGEPAPFTVPPLLPKVIVADHECAAADVVATSDDLGAVVSTIDAHPQAATSLAVLLRASGTRSVADGLHAESAVYGVLQAGSEFDAWRAGRPVRQRTRPAGPVVGVSRVGRMLHIELRRPEVRNALDAQLRDELADALVLAATDRSLSVELRGSGPAFCAGGDLDEFGSRADPASAHLIRLSRNLGWLIHRLRDRITVHVHGACVGSGVELPAFAGTVIASPDATFALPEVDLGLIPGAGGTVSIPARIGRQRTALLAFLGRPVTAATAAEWGLVDRIDDR
jgi:hypothetical protein